MKSPLVLELNTNNKIHDLLPAYFDVPRQVHTTELSYDKAYEGKYYQECKTIKHTFHIVTTT